MKTLCYGLRIKKIILFSVDKLLTSLIEVRGKTKCSCSAADEFQCIDSSNGFTMSIALVPKFKLNDDE